MSSGSSSGRYNFLNEFINGSAVQAKFSACRMQAPPIHPDTAGLQGGAVLYELAEGVFTIATNNHVIPITDADFLAQIEFKFEGFGQISLSRDEIKFCSTNEELDATVIELTEQCVKRLQQLGSKFIKLTTSREGNNIAMEQNPKGEFSFDKGYLIRLLDIAVFHLATSR